MKNLISVRRVLCKIERFLTTIVLMLIPRRYNDIRTRIIFGKLPKTIPILNKDKDGNITSSMES